MNKKLQSIIGAIAFFLSIASANATSYTWSTLAVGSSWTLVTNWAALSYPNAAGDDITIVNAALGNPVLDANRSFTNFTMTSGSLDLGGYTLTITGTAVLNGGTISNGTLNITGASTTFAGTTFSANCTMTVTSPDIYFNGSTFTGTTTINKTSATLDNSTGGNTFNGPTTFTNSGTGALKLATVAADIYNDNVTFTNTGAGGIYAACVGANQFNGNITVNNTAAGGVQFGSAGGTSILANTKIISIGGTGFTTGILLLKNFTQTGATAQSLTLTGTGTVKIGPASVFNGNITIVSPQVYLNGATYQGTLTLTKNGSTNNICVGGNTFNGVVNMTISSPLSGDYLSLANTNPDIFNADATFTTTSSFLYVAVACAGNQFNGNTTFNNFGGASAGLFSNSLSGASCTYNGNIIVNSTGTSAWGVEFGYSPNTGSATLASGKTITVGGSGFSSGFLLLRNFTQLGGTAQSLTLTGTASMFIGSNSTFNGNVNFSSPTLLLNGCTYNGTANLTKTGTTNDASTGNNIFNGTTVISNSGTGNEQLAGTTADDFNAAVTFVQTNTGALLPAYNTNCTFSKDISTAASTAVITFASSASGRVTLDGSVIQNISGTTANAPVFNRLTVNNSAYANIKLNVPITVASSLILSKGRIVSTSANLVSLNDGIVISGTSDSSFVCGPVKKIGDDAFTFPVGKGINYQALAISAPGNVADAFTAEYFNVAQTYSAGHRSHIAGTLDHISQAEYCVLDRTIGTSNIFITLLWDANSQGISNLGEVRVAHWNGTTWLDEGNGGTTGTTTAGTVQTSALITSFSPFTLASSSSNNKLPVDLLSFNATSKSDYVQLVWSTITEVNNDYFTIERTIDGNNFETILKVPGNGNSNEILEYSATDSHPLIGNSFYRLRQTDYDGHVTTYPVVAVHFQTLRNMQLQVYPNPLSKNEQLNLQLKGFENRAIKVSIFDAMGLLLFERPFSVGNNEIISLQETENFLPGNYYIRIVSDKEMLTQKLIIN